MEFAVNAVKQMLRVYETQAKTAELVREGEIKVVQNQKDRVTISSKARELLSAQQKEGAGSSSLPPPTQHAAGENVLSAQ